MWTDPHPYLLATAILLMGALLAGLVRVSRGPTTADRMLAAQFLGTTTVAILATLSVATDAPRLLDVALVFAILAAVGAVCFVTTDPSDDDRH